MLEVATVSFHTGSEANTPLLDCCIDDVLTEQPPFLHETHLQMFNVTYLAAIHSFLENAPNFVIDRNVCNYRVHTFGNVIFSICSLEPPFFNPPIQIAISRY